MTGKIQQLAYSCQQVLLDLSQPVAYRPRMALGRRLRDARDKRGLTQQDLADKMNRPVDIGANQAAISQLEVRDSETTTLLFAYADALSVCPKWLLTGEEPSGLDAPIAERDERLDEIVAIYRRFDDGEREDLVRYARFRHDEKSKKLAPSGRDDQQTAPTTQPRRTT